MFISAQSATSRPAGRRGQCGAFTLIELLVVLGILTLLATLTLPALMDMTAAKIRLQCQVNVRNFAAACDQFALDSLTAAYPEVSVAQDESAPDADDAVPDDYTQVNLNVFGQLTAYGVTKENATCVSLGKQDWLFSGVDTLPTSPIEEEQEDPVLRAGVVYWLGRDDIVDPDDDTITLFQSPHRRDRQYDPTSSTVVTCLAYDPYTSGTAADTVVPGSVMPHLGKTYAEYTYDTSPNPWDETHPDGIAVGFRGGSAKFVKFEDLTPIIQYHRLWYVNY